MHHTSLDPLTIMKGQIDVALQKKREPEDYLQVLEAVNEEVDRLIGLAGSLLTLTRPDAGNIPLTVERLAVADVVAGAVEHSHSTALQKDVELQVISGSSITMRADEDLILQFLLNFSTTRSNIRRLAVT